MNGIRRKRYNILYTTSFGHMMGGGQWSLYYLIKHLNKKKFHPIVLCPDKDELAEKMQRIGADVIYLKAGRIRYLNPFIIRKFINILKELKISLVHADSSTETFYAGIAARMLRIPLVWHIRVSEREWFLDWVLSLLSTKMILVAGAISRRFSWLKNYQKMAVIYNGINLEDFDNFSIASSIREEFNISNDTVLLGCIGRIEKRKGQESLASAMRYLDNAKLIFLGIGEKKYIDDIKMLCNKRGIADRVIFAGARDDIPAILRDIDILVFPSISGEGFPRVILEAMAAGRPVIATDDAGNPEAVEDGLTGYIIPAGNISAIVAKTTELIADAKKRRAMGRAGRKRVEELFTIQKNVKSIQKVYLDILTRHDER